MLRAHAVSEKGPVRTVNEDSFVVSPDYSLFAVADGMGGHAAGELASRLAIEAIEAFVARSHDDSDFSWPCGIDPVLTRDGNRLKTAVFLANRRVLRVAESRDDYVGMGTTVVALLASGSEAAIAHVGDSRIYLLRGGELTAITLDDSWVSSMLAANPDADAELLRAHPMRHVLTNVVGAKDEINIHIGRQTLQDGDLLLLCSDGLHAVLHPDEIASTLMPDDPEAVAAALVKRAFDRGGRDNATALVVSYTEDA